MIVRRLHVFLYINVFDEMVILKSSFIREAWFADKMQLSDAIAFSKYRQYRGDAVPWYMKAETFYTSVIDLKSDLDSILRAFSSTTRYEVRRALKEGAVFGLVEDKNEFIHFYNEFARGKGLKELRSVSKYGCSLIITSVSVGDEVLCMHAYVIDEELRRVRLLYSASHFRSADQASKKGLIGIANKFLHFEDMRYFKELAYEEYDLGGYALNSEDPVLQSINKFKDGFSGKIQESFDCRSYPFVILETLYRWIR